MSLQHNTPISERAMQLRRKDRTLSSYKIAEALTDDTVYVEPSYVRRVAIRYGDPFGRKRRAKKES